MITPGIFPTHAHLVQRGRKAIWMALLFSCLFAGARAAQPAEAAAGPRPGKYGIYSYGATPNRLYLGSIEIKADGNYRALKAGDKLLGEGKYRFDAAKSAVVWLSGPYQGSEWGGAFEISRQGKTHTIRLRTRTIATNSVD